MRGIFTHGWGATVRARQTLPLIQEWSWPFWGEAPARLPVHVLTGARDWQLAAWMLATWFRFTESSWNIVVHDDGTLPSSACETFARLFPAIRIIPRHEADAAMRRALLAFPFCQEFRDSNPRALKLFDVPHFAKSANLILFDSDLLFFAKPAEILAWAEHDSPACWFNQGAKETSLLSASEAREEFGVKLWPRVDAGLCLLNKRAIDLDFCDRALAETSLLSGDANRIAQTLLALCASRHGEGGLLPPRYEVSPGVTLATDAISRHFTASDRDRFLADGLKRVHPILFNDDFG